MSNANNQNIPGGDDQHNNKSLDQEPNSLGSENLHDRLLQDILSEKHIPELKSGEKKAPISIIEALLDATLVRAISLTANEFRLLGASILNKAIMQGLSKAFGQSPLLPLLKGEIKENISSLDNLQRYKLKDSSKQKELKEEELRTLKGLSKRLESSKGQGSKGIGESFDLDQDDLIIEENKAETIPNENEIDEIENKRYNISKSMKKATELELSMLEPTEHKSLGESLEHTVSPDLGSSNKLLSRLPLSLDRLKQCINQFSQGRILVFGDLLIDELLEGRPERISREAPVLILEHVDTVLIPGGAANTAHNVSALGGKCHAVGVCGQDDYALKLKELLEKHGIEHSLVVDQSRPTTVKTRILSKTHALMQQLLRLDRICHDPIKEDTEKSLINNLENLTKEYPVLILSDYRGGLITEEVVRVCKRLAQKQKFMLVVDAQERFERFQNVTLLTPNQPDTERAIGYKIQNEKDLLQAGEDMLLLTGAQSVLITRGKEGMSLFSQGCAPFSLPAFNRSEVYDVSGAGDTVVATIALAISTGATLNEAMALGSIAASIVVKKPGTAVTSQQEILDLLPLIKLPT